MVLFAVTRPSLGVSRYSSHMLPDGVVAESVTPADRSEDGPASNYRDDANVPTESSSGGKQVAAFFDVDNTVIRGASAYHLARELYRRKFFGTRDILRFALIQIQYLLKGESKKQIDEVRNRALSLIKGKSVAEVAAVGEQVYDEVLSLRIFPGTKQIIDDHLAKGHQVWFVTASPTEVGGLIARRLGVTGALGTQGEHKDGFYTGRLVGDLMHGEAKADAVRNLAAEQNIDLAASYAYSDSLNDLPMMEIVGNPRPINPDLRLRKHAAEVGWPIQDFRGRGAKYAGRGLRTAELAGGAWAISILYRYIKRRVKRRIKNES
jgi:HAD superfamily hydrolase (TIGR01490 family)